MALSSLFSPESLSGLTQRLTSAPKRGFEALVPHGLLGDVKERLGLEPPRKDRPAFSYGTHYKAGVDQRLTGILNEAATRFAREHPGYTIEATSGKNARKSGTRWHPGGIATDIQITDPTGKVLGNYRDAQSFRTYESFAQTARQVQQETHPELNGNFAWGGYFGGRYAADQMHFDLGPTRGTLGSWEGGLNKAGKNFLPGAVSQGIGQLGGFTTAAVPTPTARPNSPSELASLNSIQDKREYERPGFAAPLGQVDRAALPGVRGAVKAVPTKEVGPRSLMMGEDLTGPLTGMRVPGMSVPADTASPRTMAKSLRGLGGYLADNPATAAVTAPQGLDTTGLAGLQAMQDKREYERPALSHLLSPEAMAPVLSPPTTVQDRPITQTIAPQTAQPATTTIAAPTTDNTFPDAPPEPTESMFGPNAKRALAGLALGGLPGAAIGGIGGLLGNRLGPGFDAAVPSGDRFSVGSGLQGIRGALSGARGATANSLSNPGMSVTSLGNGQSLRRSENFGWTEVVDPSGSVVGINYDNPDKKGLLGSISKRAGGLLGGRGGISPGASRAIGMGKGGLY